MSTRDDARLLREQRLYDALKRITAYLPPETLAKHALKKYGLEAEEAIEMAYDNVLAEAAAAIKGMRRPMATTLPGSKEPRAPAEIERVRKAERT